MRILTISNLFPNRVEPGRAAFNRQQLCALATNNEIEVVAPLPWGRHSLRQVPLVDSSHGLSVLHPRYFVIPKILRSTYGPSLLASLFRPIRHLHSRKPVDVILGTWAYPDGWAASKLARWLNLPCVIKVHGTDINGCLDQPWRRRMIGSAFSSAQRVVAVSEALGRRCREFGATSQQVVVLPNGVDTQRFCQLDDKAALRAELGLDPAFQHILCIGNLVPIKGMDIAIRAMGLLDDNIHLHILGLGPQRASLEQLSASLGVKARVHLHGRRPHGQLPNWFNAVDAFCLPSRNEGCPNVVLEARACGSRIVATRVGGVPELLSDRNGILVEPDNPEALAEGIQRALVRGFVDDPTLAATLSWQENAARLQSILQDAIDEHASAATASRHPETRTKRKESCVS